MIKKVGKHYPKVSNDAVCDELLAFYQLLYDHFGPQNWWPADCPFEVIIGAILTQNTAWRNVEKALNNLRKANLLHPEKMHAIAEPDLAEMIRPSGYYRIKAARLKNFLSFLFENYHGSLDKMFGGQLTGLRKKLLKVKGVGPETADSILLYAGEKPVFVVDAYTKRIFSRHNFFSSKADYHEIQAFFTDHLPRKVELFNEYHALIVQVGHFFCKRTPACEECPLQDFGKLS